MDCPKCGKENRAGAGFCAWCGADMAQEGSLAESPEDQEQQTSSEPVAPQGPELIVNQDNEPAAVSADVSEVNSVEQLSTQPLVAEPTPTDSSASSEANANTLQVGDTLLDRYVIMELIQDGADHRLYRAQDLNCCAVCGSTGNSSEDTYCQNCGADLREPPARTLPTCAGWASQTAATTRCRPDRRRSGNTARTTSTPAKTAFGRQGSPDGPCLFG